MTLMRQTLTSSAPVMATILILFGIGYTIDYNSTSPHTSVMGIKLITLLLFSSINSNPHPTTLL
jgi:hypothetical protein